MRVNIVANVHQVNFVVVLVLANVQNLVLENHVKVIEAAHRVNSVVVAINVP